MPILLNGKKMDWFSPLEGIDKLETPHSLHHLLGKSMKPNRSSSRNRDMESDEARKVWLSSFSSVFC